MYTFKLELSAAHQCIHESQASQAIMGVPSSGRAQRGHLYTGSWRAVCTMVTALWTPMEKTGGEEKNGWGFVVHVYMYIACKHLLKATVTCAMCMLPLSQLFYTHFCLVPF